jgi:8-oxo-dGTP pyrophosphatase MutT (NUDIX family)
MHRTPSLEQLRAYARGDLDANERAMVTDGIAFLEAHPDAFLRSCLPGHFTGSAWIVNPDRTRTVLLLHRKLNRWLNPGGHADGDPDLLAVGRREAEEETGLRRLRVLTPTLFDFDRHWIPEHQGTPGHWHYDFRFALEADPAEPFLISAESNDLRWFDLGEVPAVHAGESMARLLRKTPALP